MKKKGGSLTWHYYRKFGSGLQADALYSYLNIHGCETFIINYGVGKRPALWKIRLFASFFDALIPRVLSSKIHYHFLNFEHKYLKETQLVRTYEDLEYVVRSFDTVICGSDQIWAPNVLNENYLLPFVPDYIRKVSYAASIGLPTIPKDKRALYKKSLSRFFAVSVRERQGQEILKNEIGISSTVVLDPTLLLDRKEWLSIARYRCHTPYILCYFLGRNRNHRQMTQEFAQKTRLPVLCLSRFPEDKTWGWNVDEDAGPQEFVGYVDNASYVITDSFHGTCFSINLGKDFYVVNRFTPEDPINQNSRIANILSLFGLENRLIDKIPGDVTSINYGVVQERLHEEREKSHCFLQQSIGLG